MHPAVHCRRVADPPATVEETVGRYCTYRQTLGYVWDHADFLSEEDRRRIFRENTLGLLAAPASR
jgi:hypothetical protein